MKFNILIAEDEDAVREVLVSIVKMFFVKEYPFLELNVFTAINGQEALDIAKKEHQDMILSDIIMPKMNGLEFIRNVRNFDKGVPILVLSALSSDKDIENIMQSGATNYTSKPLNGKLFTAQIRVFVDFYLRRQNKYNSKAINLFSKYIYKRKVEFFIDKEEDLFEFWEYIIVGIFEQYKVQSILHFVYELEFLMIKKGFSNTIIIEENSENFYLTLLNMDKLDKKIILEELKKRGIKEEEYKLDDFFLSLLILKEEEENKETKVDEQLASSRKKIDIQEQKEVIRDIRYTIHEDVTPEEFLSELDPTYEDKIENFLDDLSLVAVDIYNLENTSSEEAKKNIQDILKYLENFNYIISSLALFNVINRSFEHLIEFLKDIDNEILQNSEKRVLLSKMLQGLADDLESWIIMLFIERKADDIHYFDASFSENCFTIESTFMAVDTSNDFVEEDDLEFF